MRDRDLRDRAVRGLHTLSFHPRPDRRAHSADIARPSELDAVAAGGTSYQRDARRRLFTVWAALIQASSCLAMEPPKVHDCLIPNIAQAATKCEALGLIKKRSGSA